jgi:hypothetical protein
VKSHSKVEKKLEEEKRASDANKREVLGTKSDVELEEMAFKMKEALIERKNSVREEVKKESLIKSCSS